TCRLCAPLFRFWNCGAHDFPVARGKGVGGRGVCRPPAVLPATPPLAPRGARPAPSAPRAPAPPPLPPPPAPHAALPSPRSASATKALLGDAASGEVLEERRAAHPDGTEVDPRAWLAAADEAAGPLLERAEAVAVGGQQHGMVLLDTHGEVVRDALLWNDTRS